MIYWINGSYDEIIQRLLDDGIEVKFYLLEADYTTIHDRILKQGESETCWCMQNIQMCLDAFEKFDQGIRIQTANRTPEEIAGMILR